MTKRSDWGSGKEGRGGRRGQGGERRWGKGRGKHYSVPAPDAIQASFLYLTRVVSANSRLLLMTDRSPVRPIAIEIEGSN